MLTILFLKSLFDHRVKSVNLIAFFAFLEVLLGIAAFCTKGILWQ